MTDRTPARNGARNAVAIYTNGHGRTLRYPFHAGDTPPARIEKNRCTYELKATLRVESHVAPAPLTRAEVERIERANDDANVAVLVRTLQTRLHMYADGKRVERRRFADGRGDAA